MVRANDVPRSSSRSPKPLLCGCALLAALALACGSDPPGGTGGQGGSTQGGTGGGASGGTGGGPAGAGGTATGGSGGAGGAVGGAGGSGGRAADAGVAGSGGAAGRGAGGTGGGGTGGGSGGTGGRQPDAAAADGRSMADAGTGDGAGGPGGAGGMVGACGDPPAPPALTDGPLDSFIAGHIRLQGAAPPADLRPTFRDWAAQMGGDVFLANILRRWPSYSMRIIPSTGFAMAGGGSMVYNLSAWNGAADRRIPTLIHETIHNIDNGFNPTVMRLFAAAKADPAKRWDSYPFGLNVPAEYMASGTEWVILNDPFNGSERKRPRLKRMDPEFYCYLVNEFIPKVLYAPGANYPGR